MQSTRVTIAQTAEQPEPTTSTLPQHLLCRGRAPGFFPRSVFSENRGATYIKTQKPHPTSNACKARQRPNLIRGRSKNPPISTAPPHLLCRGRAPGFFPRSVFFRAPERSVHQVREHRSTEKMPRLGKRTSPTTTKRRLFDTRSPSSQKSSSPCANP